MGWNLASISISTRDNAGHFAEWAWHCGDNTCGLWKHKQPLTSDFFVSHCLKSPRRSGVVPSKFKTSIVCGSRRMNVSIAVGIPRHDLPAATHRSNGCTTHSASSGSASSSKKVRTCLFLCLSCKNWMACARSLVYPEQQAKRKTFRCTM